MVWRCLQRLVSVFCSSPLFLKLIPKLCNIVRFVGSLNIIEGSPCIFGRWCQYSDTSEFLVMHPVAEVGPFGWYYWRGAGPKQ